MKIAYITAAVPWGTGESFIIDEMLQMQEEGIDILIIPRNPSMQVFHGEAKKLEDNSLWLPLVNLKMIFICVCTLFTNLKIWKIIFTIIVNARSFLIFLKNMAVIPKGVFLAKYCKREKVEHIHAHWGSTTATMAYIISEITGIPWSFTVHRWDITENNMLKAKVASARFIRCISKIGLDEVHNIIGEQYKSKTQLIHMGVHINEKIKGISDRKDLFTIVCPANLLPVKGCQYLINACKHLIERKISNFQCLFIGDGPLKEKLIAQVKELELESYIHFLGRMSHNKLMKIYVNDEVDVVVLPSINTPDGEHEGIPVALMEAMSYSIPVISTITGGIPELLDDGGGLLVEEKNSLQLAYAIETLIKDIEYANKYANQGYNRVCHDFNIYLSTKELLNLIKDC